MKKEHAKYFIILAVILFTLMLVGVGCGTTKIHDILENPEKYMGKEFVVQGTVTNTMKIGSLSGFTLVDGPDKIIVSSKELPPENKSVAVRGTLMKEALIGYYLYATDIY